MSDPAAMSTGNAPTARIIRVVIADDHHGIRSALSQLLECTGDIEVIGAAADGSEAVEMAAALSPDLILMDIGMPIVDGLEATRRIVSADPSARVVTLTAFQDRREASQRAGALAHLLKDTSPEKLISCIRTIAAM